MTLKDVFDEQDWWGFCEVMRDLTWGKDCAKDWYKIAGRVNNKILAQREEEKSQMELYEHAMKIKEMETNSRNS